MVQDRYIVSRTEGIGEQLELPLDQVGTLPQKWKIDRPIKIITVSEVEQKVKKGVRSFASVLASLANAELDATRWLYREIMVHGGIRRYRGFWERGI